MYQQQYQQGCVGQVVGGDDDVGQLVLFGVWLCVVELGGGEVDGGIEQVGKEC